MLANALDFFEEEKQNERRKSNSASRRSSRQLHAFPPSLRSSRALRRALQDALVARQLSCCGAGVAAGAARGELKFFLGGGSSDKQDHHQLLAPSPQQAAGGAAKSWVERLLAGLGRWLSGGKKAMKKAGCVL